MIKVLSIIGTRPEAIKMAPVLRELAWRPGQVQSIVCSTGQHRQMLDQVLKLFDIRVDVDLNVMTHDQSLSQLTARLFTAVDEVVRSYRPDWVLAQGDTTSVMVAAMAAYYSRTRFGHVEAGLRTGDVNSPFPEEVNRRVADITAAALFAPTARSRETLLREGARPESILVTGNTVVDALMSMAEMPADEPPSLADINGAPLIVVTAHRRESFGEPLRQICMAIRSLAQRLSPRGWRVVYPVHLNPNVRRCVDEMLSDVEGVRLIEPLDYLSMLHLMKRASVVLTDSGGIQEEAPSLRVPVLVMRDTTERPEGIESGVARLVGTQSDEIVAQTMHVIEDDTARQAMTTGVNPYGDGKAATRIAAHLLRNGANT